MLDEDINPLPYAYVTNSGLISQVSFFSSPFLGSSSFHSFPELLCGSKPAIVNDKLYIFGGCIGSKNIHRLDGCFFKELNTHLKNEYSYKHMALSYDGGSKAIICSNVKRNNGREYEAKNGTVETLTKEGRIKLKSHSRRICGSAAVGLPSGNLL
ncbi:Oidioi.mRNA.OKI2018_I69.chr2.g4071.t1.cds [Oikopleura dioica]|uniref:Oidioi.mRNA.OKI2018_I69.chr2.g4071.t1.cds n=1 Tax=Oikopleura dioica TaxID=34765 RepID=A0ABN7SXT2_OIKDI|nr:Oidioi.mRNA.OKI2018_I69.chr2.g4071.t1.cds [Oikopleura dioica]